VPNLVWLVVTSPKFAIFWQMCYILPWSKKATVDDDSEMWLSDADVESHFVISASLHRRCMRSRSGFW